MQTLSRFVVDEAPIPDLMHRIVAVARDVLPAVADASMTFSRGHDDGWTAANTGDLATRLDEAQYALGHGPCMDAASGGETLLIRDFSAETRWPDYAPIAIEAGARSSLSVPLPVQQHVIAALNLYSCDVDAFADGDVALAHEIAAQAAVAVVNAALYESATQLAEGLQQAMAARATIEQAKGIIIATSHCTPDEAFAVLVKQSQHENRKLRDVAAELVALNIRSPRI
jgi:GAF domain-containing protein